jgi:hypothetical protein
MIKAIIWTIVLAISLVLFAGELTLVSPQHQQDSATAIPVSEQSDPTSPVFARELAQIYYAQGQIDLYIVMMFGEKSLKEFKEKESAFLFKCVQTNPELACRQEWLTQLTAHVAKLVNKAKETKPKKPRGTPV